MNPAEPFDAAPPPSSPLYGELTIRTAASAKATLLAAAGHGHCDVDLSQITAMDGAGLQLLLLLHREARRQGATVRFHSPSRAVRATVALARVDHLLECAPGQARP